jgi:hypothetical protein
MAYEGVVSAHTKHGMRLYLVHLAYTTALQGTAAQADGQAATAMAGSQATTVTAAAYGTAVDSQAATAASAAAAQAADTAVRRRA